MRVGARVQALGLGFQGLGFEALEFGLAGLVVGGLGLSFFFFLGGGALS